MLTLIQVSVYNGRPAPVLGWRFLKQGLPVRRKPKGNAAAILCWADERNAISEKTIFNNKQVTCVGAYVMGTSHEEEATIR